MMSSIFHRISVRKFEDRPIEKEKIVQVLKAGMQAPSACNQQPWEFYVVTEIDLSIAQQNIWLETDEIGLGGVWIGIAPIEERMELVHKMLDLPENVKVFSLFAMGYPAEERPQQDRFDPERIHFMAPEE